MEYFIRKIEYLFELINIRLFIKKTIFFINPLPV